MKKVLKSTTTKSEKIDHAVVFKAIEKEAAPLLKQLTGIKIKTAEDYKLAAEQTKALKGVAKIATARMKEITDPLNSVIDKVEELFKPFLENVKTLDKMVKDEMLAYNVRAAAKQSALDAKLETTTMRPATYVKQAEVIQAHKQSVATTRVSKFIEVVDVDKVPRNFMVPDMALIKESFKLGIPVPGCQESLKESISI